MHHKHLLYLFLLSSLPLNAMDDQKDASEMNIHEATYFGKKERVQELLDSGISADEKSKEGGYATLYIQSWGWETISFKKDLSFNSFDPPCFTSCPVQIYLKDDSPLHVATIKERQSIVELLLKNNASVNTKDKFGVSPVCQATMKKQREFLKVFLICEGDIDQKYIRRNPILDIIDCTPLLYAAEKALHSPEFLSIVKTLIKYNAPVYIKDGNGVKPLDYLFNIDGIKELYLDNEKSLKKEKESKKKKKVKRKK